MQIEMRPIGSIRPYDNNPRLNDPAVDAVAASIKALIADRWHGGSCKIPSSATQALTAGESGRYTRRQLHHGLRDLQRASFPPALGEMPGDPGLPVRPPGAHPAYPMDTPIPGSATHVGHQRGASMSVTAANTPAPAAACQRTEPALRASTRKVAWKASSASCALPRIRRQAP